MQKTSVEDFANIVSKITQTDRWVFVVADGDMGEGKSCILDKLSHLVAAKNKTAFSHAGNMTYSRKELKKWIDGTGDDRKGQKPEKSVLFPDELISMFFKRNWFDSEQIDGIELLNKCRDRHLVIVGAVPNFWDLDSAIYPLVTFWIHVHERGRAWVFQRDPNPFTNDKWHRRENEKIFRKQKNPYKCEGFICEIHFEDWKPEEREAYYFVRNEKRRGTEGQRGQKVERYARVKASRDAAIMGLIKLMPDLTSKAVADITDMSEAHISILRNNYQKPKKESSTKGV